LNFIPDKHSPFGFFKVKGSIDDYEIKRFNLLPAVKGDDRIAKKLNRFMKNLKYYDKS